MHLLVIVTQGTSMTTVIVNNVAINAQNVLHQLIIVQNALISLETLLQAVIVSIDIMIMEFLNVSHVFFPAKIVYLQLTVQLV